MANRILLRRDTAANWTQVDPVLANGEIGLETDTERFKIGNGVQPWSARSYYANAQTIAEEYAQALENAVDAAGDQVSLAAAQVDLAKAQVTLAANKVDVARAHADAANDYREGALAAQNNAEGYAQDAFQSAQQASGTGDNAMTDVLNDYDSQFRTRMETLYGRKEIRHVNIGYGSNPSGTPNWNIGWHRAAELSSLPFYVYDSYHGTDDIPEWFHVRDGSTFPEEKGLIVLDTFTEGIFYHVEMSMWLEDMQNYASQYVGKTWGMGLSTTQFANENPERIFTKTITQGDVDINDAQADFGNIGQWYLNHNTFGTFSNLMPWIYVPLKPSGRRQCTVNLRIARLES